MFEDLTSTARKTLTFVTGRGATAAAVAGAVFFKEGWRSQPWFPVVGLAVGIPVTAALATVDHSYNERRLRDHYRGEIGAVLGIAPETVTIDHLRKVALGDESQALPGNRALHEAMQRNDRHRIITVASNIISASVVIGVVAAFAVLGAPTFMLQAGSWLATTFSPLIAHLGFDVAGTTATALASTLAAGIASFGLDVVMKKMGTTMFGYETPGLIDRIEGLTRGLRHGQGIGPEQLMTLVLDAHPNVAAEITKRYGVDFAHLPDGIKRDVLVQYNPAFELEATAKALNLGLLPARELAFTIEGVRSGAHPTPGALLNAYENDLNGRRDAAPDAATHTPLHDRIPGLSHAERFVRRVRESHPIEAAKRGYVALILEPAETGTPHRLH